MNKKITLADVAKSLGISKTVVSLVINGKGDHHGISKETQRRVRERIDELNYTPNQLARGFRTGRTHTLGLIVSDISNHFYAQLARYIEDLAWSCGYTLVTCSTDEKIEKEVRQIELLLDRKVDGLIISSSQQSAGMFNRLFEQGKAHVLIDRVFDNMLSPAVSVDNYEGGYQAALHLAAQGAVSPAIFGIGPEHISTLVHRAEGFAAGLRDAGLYIDLQNHFKAPFDGLEEAIAARLEAYHNTHAMPDAIFTLNNNITTFCLKHLQRLGYSVPEQLILMGFDDAAWFAFTRPTVTVVAQPVAVIAERAFSLLMQQISATPSGTQVHEVLPVALIKRLSTARSAPVLAIED
ncbi:MAG: LacI family transcriptional regulator [Bacteroidia bacterium]|jgi:LacI family transcriptional regulator|nr:LacI family transcriptional regulator [Bacteroidia bacterium]